MKSIQNFIKESFISEEKLSKNKINNILKDYNLFDNKDWIKPVDVEFLNNIKYVLKAYCTFFGTPDIADLIDGWYFDGMKMIDDKSNKDIFNFKNSNFTNAEALVYIYNIMHIDEVFPKFKQYILDKAENGDAYYKQNKNVQEFAKFFNK